VLAREIAARHHNNRRAFVTMNDYFMSKATKIPHFRGGEMTVFQRKTTKINQTLGLLGHGWRRTMQINVREKVVCFDE
jgi:hypothetical protein